MPDPARTSLVRRRSLKMRSPWEDRVQMEWTSYDRHRLRALVQNAKCVVHGGKVYHQRGKLASAGLGAMNAVAIDLFVQRMARGGLESQAQEEFRRAGERKDARDAAPFGAL